VALQKPHAYQYTLVFSQITKHNKILANQESRNFQETLNSFTTIQLLKILSLVSGKECL
jgi:hypothetical protein